MPDERFDEHLRHPRGRGHEPAGGHDGAAGGGACGDLVRISVAVDGDRVADAGFDAAGCGATIAAASAAVELVRGAPLLAAARVGSAAVAAELGGLSAGKLHAADLAADALARALGAAVRADGAVPASEGRTLVAMSGGVDSAVAALLAGGEVVTVTLELWRDPENDGERSCCSADAVRGARALAHRMGLAHLTIDLRDEFRAGVVQPWLDEHAAGLTPNPCVRCNGEVRLDAMLALADRVGAATLTTGHYARHSPDGLLRLAADPAKDQAYMLAGLSRASLADTAEGNATLDIDLAPAEPEPGWDAKLVGQRHGVTMELRSAWRHDEASGSLELTWRFTCVTGTADERAQALALIVALHGKGTFSVADREEHRPTMSEPTVRRPVPSGLRALRDVYHDLADIQAFAGKTFGPPPDNFSAEDVHNVAYLADLLRRGRVDGTVTSGKMIAGAEALAQFRRSGSDIEVREHLIANLFGREVHVAERVVHLPPMQVRHATRRAAGDWEIELVPAAGSEAPMEIEFQRP